MEEKKIDLSQLSEEELKEVLANARAEQKRRNIQNREAYESIRAEVVGRVEQKVLSVREEVSGLHKFCVEEMGAFRKVMADYGQLRSSDQMSFTVQEGNFRIEVRSNKVKKFDERADVAAQRLIEFLQEWIKGKEDGADNPMYQLAMTLLERNANGDLDYKSISKLYQMEEKFNDPAYSDIMNLFKESHTVEGTSINFYFFEKDEMNVWKKVEPSFNRM